MIALSGERVRIGFSYDLKAECTSEGEVKSRMLEQPKNGLVEMVTENGVTLDAKDDQKFKCNEKQSDIQSCWRQSVAEG